MSLIGHYNGLTAFIKRLQEKDRKIWLHSLEMRVLEEHGGQLACDLALTIYVIQEKEAPSND